MPFKHSAFQPMRKLLPELRHLWRDHERAISLIRMLLEVVLVIVLGRKIIAVQRRDFGDDLAVEDAFFLQFIDHFQRDLPCSSECVKIDERYCVPTSLPCRLSCVGSWVAKKISSTFRYPITAGSNSTLMTSACPVVPSQTCSYVGSFFWPPA